MPDRPLPPAPSTACDGSAQRASDTAGIRLEGVTTDREGLGPSVVGTTAEVATGAAEVASVRHLDWVCTQCAGAKAVGTCSSNWCAHSICEYCRYPCIACAKWFCFSCAEPARHRCTAETAAVANLAVDLEQIRMASVPTGFLALPDTGAVNASMGYDTLLEYDEEVLAPRSLGNSSRSSPKLRWHWWAGAHRGGAAHPTCHGLGAGCRGSCHHPWCHAFLHSSGPHEGHGRHH